MVRRDLSQTWADPPRGACTVRAVLRRRFGTLVAVLAVALLAAACGGGDDGSSGSAGAGSQEIGVVYDVGGLGDQGFNDAALLALTRAEDELDVTVQEFETDDSGSDREELLRLLADQGYGLIVAVGAAFRPAVEAVAKDHEDLTFAIVDDPGSELPNVTSIDFAEEESAYLAGAAATLASTSRRIGFLGGQDDARTRRSQAGFKAGAIRIDPKVVVDVAYLPPADGGVIDPAKVREVALAQLGTGVDVVYGVPGALSDPLFAAAQERGGVKVIGADADRSLTADPAVAAVILVSLVKAVEAAVYDIIEAHAEGGLTAGTHRFGLAEEAISLSEAGSLPADARAQVDELRQKIVGLHIQVPSTP